MKRLLLITCSLFSQLTLSQLPNPNNVPNALANAMVAALHVKKSANVPKDSISVLCTYRNASCNGAQLTLSKNNEIVFTGTLTSIDALRIPNLKRNEAYNLKMTWTKHQLTESKEVATGEFVTISFSDKKSIK
jgi:hypothetical protein